MLRTGAIRSERGPDDGLRVSVMSRHTFDGDPVRKDPSIRPDLFDLHLPQLAPAPREVGRWYRSDQAEEDWQVFDSAYRRRLATQPSAWLHMARIADIAANSNVTLLCTEASPERCHRRLLAEEMKRRFPGIVLLVK